MVHLRFLSCSKMLPAKAVRYCNDASQRMMEKLRKFAEVEGLLNEHLNLLNNFI